MPIITKIGHFLTKLFICKIKRMTFFSVHTVVFFGTGQNVVFSLVDVPISEVSTSRLTADLHYQRNIRLYGKSVVMHGNKTSADHRMSSPQLALLRVAVSCWLFKRISNKIAREKV